MLDFKSSASLLALAAAIYSLALAIYRLYFHPLAKFPGPKLVALTKWPEFYRDAVSRGKFVFKIQDMHQKHGNCCPNTSLKLLRNLIGPIVRVAPNELHIDDPNFYNAIYNSNKRVDKHQDSVQMFSNPGSGFTTVDHYLHRSRRGALNSFFAKRSIMRLEHVIQEKVDKLLTHLDAVAGTGDVLRFDTEFLAVTIDIITQYSFGNSDNVLDQEKPGFEFKAFMLTLLEASLTLRHLPWLLRPMEKMPIWLADIYPPIASKLRWQQKLRKQISSVLAETSDEEKGSQGKDEDLSGPTIFHTLRDSDLPPKERSLQRLSEEAETLVSAGSETTAKTLYTTTFYIANDPRISQKLREELRTLPADAKLPQIEQLPYLTAVIKEGLRLSFSVTTRLPRVFYEPLHYGDWVIPPKTPVSSTIYFISTNAGIFPNPFAFDPDRWIRAEESGQRLDRFALSFSKGSRACLGIKYVSSASNGWCLKI